MQIKLSYIKCYGWQCSLGEFAPKRQKSMKPATVRRYPSFKGQRNHAYKITGKKKKRPLNTGIKNMRFAATIIITTIVMIIQTEVQVLASSQIF